MENKIIRAMALDNNLRVTAIINTEVVEEARRRHDLSPLAAITLGRIMAANQLLTWGLKGEGSVTLRFLGEGPIGGAITQAYSDGSVRGYVGNSQVALPLTKEGRLDVSGAIGEGSLYITKDIGLREPYTGTIPLISGEVGDDIAKYLTDSEQVPSLVSVGVLVDIDNKVIASGGIIIQAMPDAPEDALDKIEENAFIAKGISILINNGASVEDIIKEYLQDIDYNILEETDVRYECNCSKEKVKTALYSLGAEDLQDLLEKEGKCESRCHFCNENYVVEKEEIEEIIEDIKKQNN